VHRQSPIVVIEAVSGVSCMLNIQCGRISCEFWLCKFKTIRYENINKASLYAPCLKLVRIQKKKKSARFKTCKLCKFWIMRETRDSLVGWGTTLEDGRSRVWVPVRWIFSIDLVLPAALGVVSASNRNESQESSWGVKGGWRVGLTT
jgi:hypothetical protein